MTEAELPPAVRELIEKGWTYVECVGEVFALKAPGQDKRSWWRVDPDGRPVKHRTRRPEVIPPPTPLAQLIEKLTERVQEHHVDPHDKTRNGRFTLSQVRSLVRQGYSGVQVQQMTGWGGHWYADLLDTDGYYNEERELA